MKPMIVLVCMSPILGIAINSFAQGVQTGTVRGTVKDQQDLPMPGVTVTGTSAALQGPRTVVTDGTGVYTLPNLPAGDYEVKFELDGFATVTQKTSVPLGLTVDQNVTMRAAGVAETVRVVAQAPPPIATAILGANLKHDEIEALATSRTLLGITTLSPALTTNTPNTQQVSINGAFAFDNVFMVNGVDVNDNLFGQPQNLFIEDAIQETQVLTSGISAEYGRFSGGVINAITKSGGNTFSGSYRINFSNPRWSTRTPFETCDSAVTAGGCTRAPERPDDVQLVHEGTLGGPIVRNRLWFFGSGRYSDVSTAGTLPVTNLAYNQGNKNTRGEIKLTATARNNHTIQGGYLNNATDVTSAPTFPFTIDPAATGAHTEPNWYTFLNYRGILRSNLLAEAQVSRRKFAFNGAGGSSPNLVDSPFVTLHQDLAHYNAQYFDATDPEHRNNLQLTGNLTYFSSRGKGRHQVKGGFEFFRSQRTGGNSQSSTNYVFLADYAVNAAGTPVRDGNGRLIPVFTQFDTQVLNWIPVRGAVLDVDNRSLFAQDHWVINNHWSVDLGLRYEHVGSEAQGGIVGVKTNTVVPRLAAAFDVLGDARHIVHVTYGHYAGRYNEAQIGANSNVANPNLLVGVYTGPDGQGRGFAPGFDPANYFTVFGRFPSQNVSFESGLSSPIVKEFTTSYGASIRGGKGYAEASYIWRDTTNFIEDFISLANGVTNAVQDGEVVGTFTNSVYRNTDLAFRKYQALQFQSRYNLSARWTVNSNYTVQLKNDGNYEGEAPNQPGLVSVIGDYPEAFTASRHYPDGRLANFQRHKFLLWSIYNVGLRKWGDASVSGLLRVNSGTTYSLAASGVELSDIQKARLSAYPDAPSSQTLFFGERGSQQFKGYGVLDFDVSYNVPVFRTLRPWVKFDIYNLFNNQKLIGWNTAVIPDPNSPKDSLGLPTGYLLPPAYGKASSNGSFPIPFLGFDQTGGKTYRVSVGFRF